MTHSAEMYNAGTNRIRLSRILLNAIYMAYEDSLHLHSGKLDRSYQLMIYL